MSNLRPASYGMVMLETVSKFRSMLKNHEQYTDEELAHSLVFLGSLEAVFANVPRYLPPLMRAALVANEMAPFAMATFIEEGIFDPSAIKRYIDKLHQGEGTEEKKGPIH